MSPAIVVDSAETPAQNGHAHEHIAEPQTAPAPVIAHSSVEPAPAKKDYSAPQAKPEAKAPASAPVTQPVQSEPKAVVDAVAEDHAKEHKEERHVELKESSPPKANESEKEKKRQNALTRTVWTLIMIGGFLSKFGFVFASIDMVLISLAWVLNSNFGYGAWVYGHPCHALPDLGVSRGDQALHVDWI